MATTLNLPDRDRIEPRSPPERPQSVPPAEEPPPQTAELVPETTDSDWSDTRPGEWQPPD